MATITVDDNTMVTIENTGKPIDEHRCANGFVFTLSDNQCKDVPAGVVEELKKEYNWLKVVGVTTSNLVEGVPPSLNEDVTPTSETSEAPAVPGKDYIESLNEGVKHVCSVCAEQFKSHQGMRVHMGSKHK